MGTPRRFRPLKVGAPPDTLAIIAMANPIHGAPRPSRFHTSWQLLGAKAPGALADSCAAVQRALWALGRVAAQSGASDRAHGPGALEWLEDHRAIASPVLPGTRGVRAALRPGGFTLFLFDVDGATIKTLPLERCSVEDAAEWLKNELAAVGADPAAIGGAAVSNRSTPPPAGPIGVADPASLAEVERWLCNGDHVLRAVARSSENTSAVRCPSERLALVAELSHRTREGEPQRIVAVGLSMGDEERSEPHFFVRVRPVGQVPGSDPRWEMHGHQACAVLTGTDIVRHRADAAQAASVEAFLEEAISSAHELVHREWRRR